MSTLFAGAPFKHMGSGISPSGTVSPTFNYDDDIPLRRYVGATLFIFFSAGFFFYWTAVPLANTVFVDGYPQFGIPPSPGKWTSNRYGWEWWHIWLLTLNGALPILLAVALTNNNIDEYRRLHKFAGIGLVLLNLWVFLVLTIGWFFMCNSNGWGGWTGCIDYRWCCANYAGSGAQGWCSNVAPCVPNVLSGDLVRNQEMTTHWAFSMIFFLLTIWNLTINADFREYGLLH